RHVHPPEPAFRRPLPHAGDDVSGGGGHGRGASGVTGASARAGVLIVDVIGLCESSSGPAIRFHHGPVTAAAPPLTGPGGPRRKAAGRAAPRAWAGRVGGAPR